MTEFQKKVRDWIKSNGDNAKRIVELAPGVLAIEHTDRKCNVSVYFDITIWSLVHPDLWDWERGQTYLRALGIGAMFTYETGLNDLSIEQMRKLAMIHLQIKWYEAPKFVETW